MRIESGLEAENKFREENGFRTKNRFRVENKIQTEDSFWSKHKLRIEDRFKTGNGSRREETLGESGDSQTGNRLEQYFFVIRELTAREIKRKYARSYLGILWSVLNPLLSMAVMSMIFSTIFKRNIENFPIYYLTGSIFWSLFTGATNSAMTALVDNKSMLVKVKLPMEIFPLSRCFTALTNFGYSLVAYVVMLLVFRIPFTPYMLMVIPYALALFLFSVGLGYLLSVLYTMFGDIKHLYSILLTLLMYASALFYPVESTSESMQKIIVNNPVYNYIACARKCVLEAAMPDANQWARMFVWSAGVFLFGKWYFQLMKNKVLQKV